MTTTLNPAAQALIDAGGNAIENEIVMSINDAAIAVGKLFSLVQDDKLSIGVLAQLIEWAENPTAAPQQSTGQPAALGASTNGGQQPPAASPDPSQITSQQALTALAAHEPRLGAVFQRLIMGLENPKTPGALVVNQNGEFTELEAAKKEVSDKETARANAVRELEEERDQSKVGSLAHKLAAAQTAAATPTDVVEKAKVVAGLNALRDMVVNIAAPVKVKLKGKAEALQAIDDEIAKVS